MTGPDDEELFGDRVAEGTDQLAKAIVDSMCEESDTLRPGDATIQLLLTTSREVSAWHGAGVDLTDEQNLELLEIVGRNLVVLALVAGVAAQALNQLKALGAEIHFPDRLEPPDFPPSH